MAAKDKIEGALAHISGLEIAFDEFDALFLEDILDLLVRLKGGRVFEGLGEAEGQVAVAGDR